MVADMEVDMVADMEVDNLVRELVIGVGQLGPNFFDPKLIRLAHLLSFASLFFTHLQCLVPDFDLLKHTWNQYVHPTYDL